MDKDALCEFCHGSASGLAQTNVMDGVLRISGEPLRGGGFKQAKMNTRGTGNRLVAGYGTKTTWTSSGPVEWSFPVGNATASGNVTSTHSLDVEGVIWGSGAISDTPKAGGLTTLECVSCHDPHIFGLTYRMLRKNPEGGAEASGTVGKLVTDQLTFNKANSGSGNSTTILSYTTSDYSNTVIYKKTWDGVSGNWTLTPLLISSKYPTSYAAPKVYKNGTVVQVYYDTSGNGTSWGNRDMYSDQLIKWCTSCHDRYYTPKGLSRVDTGDAIYMFGHRIGDTPVVWGNSTGVWRYETSPSTTSYGSSSSAPANVRYNCMVCHTAHGTTASMTGVVKAQPWPGEGDGAWDELDNGNTLGNGSLAKDEVLTAGNFTDHDGDARSNLLRLDNRGVCQSCHQIGKDAYTTATLR
jgi:hypothetical protein